MMASKVQRPHRRADHQQLTKSKSRKAHDVALLNVQALSGNRSTRRVAAHLSDNFGIQRWKSSSLKHELDLNRIGTLRGRARTRGGNSWGTDDELIPYLPPEEVHDLSHLQDYQEMKSAGLADDLHHILPRDTLNEFYDQLSDVQQTTLRRIFGSHGDYGYRPRDASGRNVLLSLRSNLVPGPKGRKRADDPNNGFDPVYLADGSLNRVSKIKPAAPASDRMQLISAFANEIVFNWLWVQGCKPGV